MAETRELVAQLADDLSTVITMVIGGEVRGLAEVGYSVACIAAAARLPEPKEEGVRQVRFRTVDRQPMVVEDEPPEDAVRRVYDAAFNAEYPSAPAPSGEARRWWVVVDCNNYPMGAFDNLADAETLVAKYSNGGARQEYEPYSVVPVVPLAELEQAQRETITTERVKREEANQSLANVIAHRDAAERELRDINNAFGNARALDGCKSLKEKAALCMATLARTDGFSLAELQAKLSTAERKLAAMQASLAEAQQSLCTWRARWEKGEPAWRGRNGTVWDTEPSTRAEISYGPFVAGRFIADEEVGNG